MSRYEWTDDALCATIWPEAPWVSERRVDPALLDLCTHACPVRRDCARTALEIADQYQATRLTGIWAGVSLPHSDGRDDALAELRRIAQPLSNAQHAR